MSMQGAAVCLCSCDKAGKQVGMYAVHTYLLRCHVSMPQMAFEEAELLNGSTLQTVQNLAGHTLAQTKSHTRAHVHLRPAHGHLMLRDPH
jgi:hypothetical protein